LHILLIDVGDGLDKAGRSKRLLFEIDAGAGLAVIAVPFPGLGALDLESLWSVAGVAG